MCGPTAAFNTAEWCAKIAIDVKVEALHASSVGNILL